MDDRYWYALDYETGEIVTLGSCKDWDEANAKAPDGSWIADPDTAAQWRAALTTTVRSRG